jgi:hypothetical protein
MSENTKKEIERIQQEIEKTSALTSNCPACNHPACDKITEFYFENNKQPLVVANWFTTTFKKEIKDEIWETHFREHIDPFTTEISFIKKKKLDELKERSIQAQQENSNKFNLIKQITWEFILDIYVNKDEDLKSSSAKTNHQKMSKQFCDLAKIYREYHQMELEIIGMGKTEEEQRQEMEKFVAGMLKQAKKALSDFPDAQERLQQYINLNVEGRPEKEVVIEEDDGI